MHLWKGNKVLGFLQMNQSDCNIILQSEQLPHHHGQAHPGACTLCLGPYLQKDIQQLEQVQHWAARFTFKDYSEITPGCIELETMPPDLGLESLEERRKVSRFVMLDMINNRLVRIDKQ